MVRAKQKPNEPPSNSVRLTFDNWLGLLTLAGAIFTGVWYGAAKIEKLATMVEAHDKSIDQLEHHVYGRVSQ